jgi:hypothetical protein
MPARMVSVWISTSSGWKLVDPMRNDPPGKVNQLGVRDFRV